MCLKYCLLFCSLREFIFVSFFLNFNKEGRLGQGTLLWKFLTLMNSNLPIFSLSIPAFCDLLKKPLPTLKLEELMLSARRFNGLPFTFISIICLELGFVIRVKLGIWHDFWKRPSTQQCYLCGNQVMHMCGSVFGTLHSVALIYLPKLILIKVTV